ncbi:uncharacterized protein LOC127834488 [Dreissena polymorpha]|uniref:CCHC-type domain-containing protein n=1 Tax=Dreissena polymorpha TaxID=45954 RepID=A0A9D4FWE5_DREPO|nr:uncharacterized protein LOC127834488 [Dreissena polymorpha]KAH3804388.1 hypothetical protein DPMN_132673 [Dreissena polymorpha]
MTSTTCNALDEESMDKEMSERTIRIQGPRGASMVLVVGLLQELGIESDDVDAIASGPPGSNAYDVVFREKDKCTSFLSYLNKGARRYKDFDYEFSMFGRQIVTLKVHWLPVCTRPMVIHEIFSKFGKVVAIKNDILKIGDFKTMSGVRLVSLEVSVSEKAAIPHIVAFDCGAKAQVTMQGRPPLCLRCLELGHVRGACPGSVTNGTARFSGSWADRVRRGGPKAAKSSADVTPSQDTEGDLATRKVAPDGSLEPISEAQWQQVKKGRSGKVTQKATPTTNEPKVKTAQKDPVAQEPAASKGAEGSTVQASTEAVKTTAQGEAVAHTVNATDSGAHHEMDTDIQGMKRTRDEEEHFTPMAKNKPGSGPVSSPEDPFEGMFTQDSVIDGLLASQSPHHNAIN